MVWDLVKMSLHMNFIETQRIFQIAKTQFHYYLLTIPATATEIKQKPFSKTLFSSNVFFAYLNVLFLLP